MIKFIPDLIFKQCCFLETRDLEKEIEELKHHNKILVFYMFIWINNELYIFCIKNTENVYIYFFFRIFHNRKYMKAHLKHKKHIKNTLYGD